MSGDTMSAYNSSGCPPGFQGEGGCSFLQGKAVLSEGAGWGILVLGGLILAGLTMSLMFVTIRYDRAKRHRITADNFTTANRLMGPGFTASVLVSQWTWVATLVQSSNMAWRYGVAGPFWYAAGAAVQLVIFALLAVQVKRTAPGAHTICEIVLSRWGHAAHYVFISFCLLANIVVHTMLIIGGSTVLAALTGISRVGCTVALPLMVTAYTVQGGLRATYLASISHNLLVFALSLTFCFKVYASNDSELGSPDIVYRRLLELGESNPVEGNRNGSFLTFWSHQGVLFGVMNVVGNFGTVFVDQAYWQTAFACKNPLAARRGFILGGLAWFSIPFAMATAMGLGARALNLPITPQEADMGLVPAAVALRLFGETGAFLFAIQVVTAVASSGSSEQLAVASIVTFDIYKRYINSDASGKQVIRTSRTIIFIFGCVSGPLAVLITEGIGLSLDWIYSSQGIFLGSAVLPIVFCLTWKDCSGLGAISGSVGGLLLGLVSWIASAQILHGSVSIVTLREDIPVVVGNLVSILSSGLIAVTLSVLKPQRFEWDTMRSLMRMFLVDQLIGVADEFESRFEEAVFEHSRPTLRRGIMWSTGITFVILILWPLLALCEDVLSLAHFKVWVGLSMGSALLSGATLLVFPLVEARSSIKRMLEAAFETTSKVVSVLASGALSPSNTSSADPSMRGGYRSSRMPKIQFPDPSTVRGILKKIPSVIRSADSSRHESCDKSQSGKASMDQDTGFNTAATEEYMQAFMESMKPSTDDKIAALAYMNRPSIDVIFETDSTIQGVNDRDLPTTARETSSLGRVASAGGGIRGGCDSSLQNGAAVASESGSSSSGGRLAEQTGWSEAPSGPVVPTSPVQTAKKRAARAPAGERFGGEGEMSSGEIMPLPEGTTDQSPEGAGAGHVMVGRVDVAASSALDSHPVPVLVDISALDSHPVPVPVDISALNSHPVPVPVPVDISGVELSLQHPPSLPRPAALD